MAKTNVRAVPDAIFDLRFSEDPKGFALSLQDAYHYALWTLGHDSAFSEAYSHPLARERMKGCADALGLSLRIRSGADAQRAARFVMEEIERLETRFQCDAWSGVLR